MCFEMGLHRKEVLSRESQRADSYWLAPRLFWSIFVLDRRWSFGTGLPFAIQDADIDPHLPEPVCTKLPLSERTSANSDRTHLHLI